ncbi:MAG: hypothetical protein LBR80_00310, partial [Deltaproteobacteria bacterium]|nr:hypothetical protein [Deltaproteobacteria bacterium]
IGTLALKPYTAAHLRTLYPDTLPSNDCQEVREGVFAVESINLPAARTLPMAVGHGKCAYGN